MCSTSCYTKHSTRGTRRSAATREASRRGYCFDGIRDNPSVCSEEVTKDTLSQLVALLLVTAHLRHLDLIIIEKVHAPADRHNSLR